MRRLLDRMPSWVKDVLFDVIGSIPISIGLYNFAAAAKFVPGGISGLSMVFQEILSAVGINLTLGVLNLILNIPIVIFAWHHLGKGYLLRSFRTMVIVSIFLDYFAPLIPLYQGERIFAAIFGGACIGFGLAVIFSNNTCTGGVDLIVLSVKKMHPHMSLGELTLIVDGIIIIAGGFVYRDIDAVFLGIIYTYLVMRVMDTVMSGALSGKMALIITDDGFGLGNEIDKKVQRGVTIIQGKGGYSKQDKEIVLCALSRQQLPTLRKVIKEYDPKSLLIVQEYNEAFGLGFQPIDKD